MEKFRRCYNIFKALVKMNMKACTVFLLEEFLLEEFLMSVSLL